MNERVNEQKKNSVENVIVSNVVHCQIVFILFCVNRELYRYCIRFVFVGNIRFTATVAITLCGRKVFFFFSCVRQSRSDYRNFWCVLSYIETGTDAASISGTNSYVDSGDIGSKCSF